MRLFKSGSGTPAAEKMRQAGSALKSRVGDVASWLFDLYQETTPEGRAKRAWAKGDSRFAIELSVDHRTMGVVQDIEKVGWHYEGVQTHRVEDTTTGVYSFTRRRP